jgi:hypothetical protein
VSELAPIAAAWEAWTGDDPRYVAILWPHDAYAWPTLAGLHMTEAGARLHAGRLACEGYACSAGCLEATGRHIAILADFAP